MELRILTKYGSLYPSRILDFFLNDAFFQTEHEKNPWTFIVLGRGGPTGKTWLCSALQKCGFTAFELSESIMPFVSYQDNGNHVIKDGVNRTIVIVLNRSLREDV